MLYCEAINRKKTDTADIAILTGRNVSRQIISANKIG